MPPSTASGSTGQARGAQPVSYQRPLGKLREVLLRNAGRRGEPMTPSLLVAVFDQASAIRATAAIGGSSRLAVDATVVKAVHVVQRRS
jgi:hypothetical protein